jgi:hypothetical protein
LLHDLHDCRILAYLGVRARTSKAVLMDRIAYWGGFIAGCCVIILIIIGSFFALVAWNADKREKKIANGKLLAELKDMRIHDDNI